MPALSPTRRTTMQRVTVEVFSRAASAFFFSGTTPPRRQPPSAVMT
jgi:hypothetical protein